MSNNQVELEISCSLNVSYTMLMNEESPINRLYVKNITEEDILGLTIKIFSKPDFILATTIEQDILPRKSTITFKSPVKVSPVFLVGLDKRTEGEITVQIIKDGNILEEEKSNVSILAFNECDYGAKYEKLACFVRKTSETAKLHNLVNQKLIEWKIKPVDINSKSSKNTIRFYIAALYSVLIDFGFVLAEQEGNDVIIASQTDILKNKVVSSLELTLIFASVLENAQINCIIGQINNEWHIGGFLVDECFKDVVLDDATLIEFKSQKGVNDICLISVLELFNGMSFEANEKKSSVNIKKFGIDFFVDLKRARVMNLNPVPERIKSKVGYDLVDSSDYQKSVAPKVLEEFKGVLTGDLDVSREKQWERRLLDLDMRNSLLNFKVSQNNIKILTAKLDDFIDNITLEKEYQIAPLTDSETDVKEAFIMPFEKSVGLKPLSDLILYEYKNKRLKVAYQGREFERELTLIYKKEKSHEEESGANALYLAAGFLKWNDSDDLTEFKYAPILLYPATMYKRGSSNPSFFLSANEDEIHINNTLLEYLYQKFNIDIRGLAEVKCNSLEDIHSILNSFKKEIVLKKGWGIYDSVYLCTLSFSNYLMWKDVRTKIDKFKENKIIRSLINNNSEFDAQELKMDYCSSDGVYLEEDKIYLPISADTSQYSAIKDSLKKSFVLEGPPGTGKSQTITNIIVNNIVRGRRVLFVAEKMAALSVVNKRLKDIGVADFCLELYSDKTKKVDIVNKIVETLNLKNIETSKNFEENKEEINALVGKLQKEKDALHKKQNLGFSIYEGIINYLDNEDAPDCLRIDSLFYEKLTKDSFNKYLELLTELSLRAKECGNIEKSPFKYVGEFNFDEKWRIKGESILEIYLMELTQLRNYAKKLLPIFNIRTASLTEEKLSSLYNICKMLSMYNCLNTFFSDNNDANENLGVLTSFLLSREKENSIKTAILTKYEQIPNEYNVVELLEAKNNLKKKQKLVKKICNSIKFNGEKNEKDQLIDLLIKIEENKLVSKDRIKKLAIIYKLDENNVNQIEEDCLLTRKLYSYAKNIYADLDNNIFNESCYFIAKNSPVLNLEYFISTYELKEKARKQFEQIFCISSEMNIEDISETIDYISSLYKNLDLIGGWCKYQEIVSNCKTNGFEFVLEPLKIGEITADDILSCFKKCVFYNFVKSEIMLDSTLCQFSGMAFEEMIERFKNLSDEFERLTRQELYKKLVDNIPKAEDEGEHNLEKVILYRAQKNNMKGMTLRKLFEEIPTILKATCPCILMSPSSVTQFLDIDMDKFDLVVFDEASQVPTCKAVGTIARAKDVIIVGDPKQLPPTVFFGADFKSEENIDVEDLDSILDDCLAIGMPVRHLLWHYRSHHESLIAFSNAMFYDNTLLTFPSPNELNSKVTMQYIDGVYDRGKTKHNAKEAEELVKDVISRLKNPTTNNQSLGVVTFNTSQQIYIEELLTKAIRENNLDIIAYERYEPLFVKNLESVQGDERDVILFSVGFGPDKQGKLSLNFGPLNQNGGYRRLNVAVTRARMEMKVFSSIKANMIDLNKTSSQGVKSLKSFLEYAERGREMLVFDSKNIVTRKKGIGEFIAKELKDRGLKCDYDIGVSDFKIDVAIVDPKDKDKYILAIICDSENEYKIKSVKDRVAMQTKILKTLGWNVYYLWTINYLNNPKREIAKIKDYVNKLTLEKTINKKSIKESILKYKRVYKQANLKQLSKAGADYVMLESNLESIKQKISAIISIEQPIESGIILERLLNIYNVNRTSKKAVLRLLSIIDMFKDNKIVSEGVDFYLTEEINFFRPLDAKTKRDFSKIYIKEIVNAVRCAIETGSSFSLEDLTKEVLKLFNITRKTKLITDRIEKAIDFCVKEGYIIAKVDGTFTI